MFDKPMNQINPFSTDNSKSNPFANPNSSSKSSKLDDILFGNKNNNNGN